MPRFFFHVQDGTFFPDHRGTEFPNLRDAYTQAIATTAHLLQDAGIDLLKVSPWRMEVTDELGQLLLTLNFSAELAPKPLAA